MEYINCSQFAKALSRKGVNVTRQLVRLHAARKTTRGSDRIRAKQVGRVWMIPESEVENFEAFKEGKKVYFKRKKK